MERHSSQAERFTARNEQDASRFAPPSGERSSGSPAIPPDDRPLGGGEPEAMSDVAEQLDTIQQRLFALGLALGLAGSNSTDGTTVTELRRLEGLVADLIVDVRAWTHPLMATGPDGVPQGRRDVSPPAESAAAHGRDHR